MILASADIEPGWFRLQTDPDCEVAHEQKKHPLKSDLTDAACVKGMIAR
jgi:hypothetical protein